MFSVGRIDLYLKHLLQKHPGFFPCEAQVLGSELRHLTPGPQLCDRYRGIDPAGDDQVHRQRGMLQHSVFLMAGLLCRYRPVVMLQNRLGIEGEGGGVRGSGVAYPIQAFYRID